MLERLVALICLSVLGACANNGTVPGKSASGFSASQLAFQEDYRGDRVLAFTAGLGSMIQTAFQDKTDRTVVKEIQSLATAVFLPIK